MNAVAPRYGVELELLAPTHRDRDAVAAAIAARVPGATLQVGFKHRVDGELAPGRPRCVLSLAARVVDSDGAWVCDVVDDPTIRGHADPVGQRPALILDDTRLALWLAAKGWRRAHGNASLAERLATLTDTFDGTLDLSQGLPKVVDPWGQVLALVEAESAAHHRVCEVVTAPLPKEKRDALVAVVVDVANHLGCTIPETAALHLHLDAGAWTDGPRLARLIRGWSSDRESHLQTMRANRRCLKLGNFPDDVTRVADAVLAAGEDVPWSTVATGLVMAGVRKELDLNLRGVVDSHPLQPTLEVRCLPMSLDVDDVIASLNAAEGLLERLALEPD